MPSATLRFLFCSMTVLLSLPGLAGCNPSESATNAPPDTTVEATEPGTGGAAAPNDAGTTNEAPATPQPAAAGTTADASQPAAANTAAPKGTAAAAAASTPLAAGKGEDWPAFLGPRHDSKSRETGLLNPWPPQGPPVLWTKEIGTSYGICTIADGQLYQFDRYEDSARLTAMDATTGEFRWKFEYPSHYVDAYNYNNGPRTSPIVDGDLIYIYGVGGMLHCLKRANGELVWKVDTQEKYGVVQNFFGVGSSPVVEGDLLIVMVGGSTPETADLSTGQLAFVEPNGTGIVAFDKRTGEVRYEIVDELASYASLQLATIGDRRWCFAFCRGGLVGFEPSTGKVDFRYPWRARNLESVNASVPVVVGNEVFISETYGPGSSLLSVRPGGYDLVWADEERARDKAMQTHWNTAVYVDGYLYGSSGRHLGNAELRCIDWKTGEVQWSEPNLTRSSLLYADGHFICQSEDGVLRLLRVNPKKYDVVSEAVLRGKPTDLDVQGPLLLEEPCWAAPVLAHGLLYVRGDGRLVCLDLRPGK